MAHPFQGKKLLITVSGQLGRLAVIVGPSPSRATWCDDDGPVFHTGLQGIRGMGAQRCSTTRRICDACSRSIQVRRCSEPHMFHLTVATPLRQCSSMHVRVLFAVYR